MFCILWNGIIYFIVTINRPITLKCLREVRNIKLIKNKVGLIPIYLKQRTKKNTKNIN